MRPNRLAVALSLALAASACASKSKGPAAGATSAAPRPQSAAPDLLTQAEVQATPVSNMYDLVNRLRPNWLRQQQGTASIGGGTVRGRVIVVYYDNVRVGSLDALRTLTTSGVKGVRDDDASRAATGLGDPGPAPVAGAIVISTKGTP